MPDFPEHLISQAILAAQARFEAPEKAAVDAAQAYAAAWAAYKKEISPSATQPEAP